MISDKFKKIFKKIFLVLTGLVGLMALFVLFSYSYVSRTTKGKIYTEVSELPTKDVGLLLGTSSRSRSGNVNLFFKYRIDAAVELYKAGKIKHIIVSGDNHVANYNEPRDMRDALVKRGIPEKSITLDYAGFRTLDSVVRCKEVFGQDSYVVISQEFHNRRAIFLANKKGIDAIAFNARDVDYKYSKVPYLREYLARTKAVLDIYVLKKEPKFLGKKEHIDLG